MPNRWFQCPTRKLPLTVAGTICLVLFVTVLMKSQPDTGGYKSDGWDVKILQQYYDSFAQKTRDVIGNLANVFETPIGLLPVNCTTGTPCVYDEEVDLRIIVITYNRKASVMKLLGSLQDLELDGDKAILEIWLDVDGKGKPHNETYEAVKTFKWSKGPTRVHLQTSHAGIMGQWIDTWRPKKAPAYAKNPEAVRAVPFKADDYREIGLILEDDLNISSQAYRWLKAAHRKYLMRIDYAGSSLWSDFVEAHNTRQGLSVSKNQSAFMYICIGTWGFAPSPILWAEFQDWFHMIRSSKNASSFHPYVEGAVPTGWYKQFEAQGTQDGMWEMWFIYYADFKKAFTVMNNLGAVNSDTNSCLSINRREVGLHYPTKGNENLCQLLSTWNSTYVDILPTMLVKYDWNGRVVS